MGDEFIKDGVADPALKVAEQRFCHGSFMGRRDLKAEATDVGLVEGQSQLQDTVRYPGKGLMLALPFVAGGEAGGEGVVVFHVE